MLQNFAKKLLKNNGWDFSTDFEIPSKCVICIAPHTSNWDFIWCILCRKALDIKSSFLIKKEWFSFPFGKFMRSLGGIPVDRSKKTSLTDKIAAEFAHRNFFRIGIMPEGTRSFNADWKKGFYFIAQKARVPIVLGYIDYAKKKIGFGKIFQPTGNMEEDLKKIKEFYKYVTAKTPENFGY